MVEPHVAGELDEVVILFRHIAHRALDQAVEGLSAFLLVLPRPGLLTSGHGLRELCDGPVVLLLHRHHCGLGIVGDLPGPEVRARRGLLQLVAILVVGHIDQGDGAVVLLGGLIHQVEDALGASQCHDHRVHLLGDLADGVGKALGELEEGGDGAQSNGAADAVQCQGAARHGDDDILDIADVDEDGHEDVGVLVGLIGALKQGVVDLAEALLGLGLMAEDLDYLLAVDHLLDVAVQVAQLHLLADEIAAAAAGQEPGDAEHPDDAHDDHSGQGQIGGQHAHKGDQDHHAGVDHLGDALGEHLAQGVHVVGVDAHHVAVGVGIKVLDGQGLHVAEQVVPDALLHALGDGDHQAVVGEGTQGAHDIQPGHHQKDPHQAAVIGGLHGQQGGDVVVDQVAQKQGPRHRGDGADEDAEDHQHEQSHIAPAHIAHQPADRMAALYRRSGGLIHSPRLPSSGTHRSPDRSHRSGAAARGCPWR